MAEKYYCNISTGRWIRSPDDPVDVKAPSWGYGDVKSIGVTFCENAPGRAVTVVSRFTSAQLGVGTIGSAAITSATAGSPTSNEFPFTVPLNLAAVLSYLGGSASRGATIEFLLSDATGPNRYHFDLTIKGQILTGSTQDPTPPEVAVGRNEAAALYVPKVGVAGGGFTLKNSAGEEFFVYMGDDRQLHADPV